MSAPSDYTRVAEVTPSDTLENAFMAFSVGTNGDVTVVDTYGSQATIFCVAGLIYPVRVAKIMETGTDAGDIVGYN